MESRSLEINVIDAKDLKDVNLFQKMDVYAVISISGDLHGSQKTSIDKEGGTNPKWNHPISFTVYEPFLQQNRLTLDFLLQSHRLLGDKTIGTVNVSLKELLDNPSDGDKSFKGVSYQVRTLSGKPKGTINFSYRFGEIFTPPVSTPLPGVDPTAFKSAAAPEPVMAYPPPYQQQYPPPYAAAPPPYPQPPAGQYGYAAPPPPAGAYPPAYGYQNAGGGYGYGYGYGQMPVQQQQQQVQQKKKGSKFGLGLGAGLLGGLLVGDMVSGMSESAYDAGFDDGMDVGGFD